jgi:hypothetical protein
MQGKKDKTNPMLPLMSILNGSLFLYYKPSNIFSSREI